MEIVATGLSISISGVSLHPSNSSAQSTQVKQAVNAINESEMLGYDRQMRYTQDGKTNRSVVEIMDRSTGERITQIPDEVALMLADSLHTRK